jgi:hypothetical protein
MKLLEYSIREILNIMLCYFLLLLMVKEFNDGHYLSLLYAFCLSIELDSMFNRLRKFKRYYPDFVNDWLQLVD